MTSGISDMGVVYRPNQHVVDMVLHIRWLTQSACGRTHVSGYCTKVLLNIDVKEWTIMSKLNFGLYTTATDAQRGSRRNARRTAVEKRTTTT